MSFLAPLWSSKQLYIYPRRTTVPDFWLKVSFLKFFSKSQNRIHFLKDLCIKYAWHPRKNAWKIQNFHFLQNRSKFILSIGNRSQIIVRHLESDWDPLLTTWMNLKQLLENRIFELQKRFLLIGAGEGLKTNVFMGFKIWSGHAQNELSDATMIVKASLHIA